LIFAHPTTEKDYISQWKNSTPKREILKDKWTHITAVANENRVSIFIDGEFANAEPCYELPRHSRFPIHIGKSTSFQNGMCGLVGDVRLYTRALSAEEIRQIIMSSQPPDLFSVVVSDSSLRNDDVSQAPREPPRAPAFAEECEPFRSLAAGILDWQPGTLRFFILYLFFKLYIFPLRQRPPECGLDIPPINFLTKQNASRSLPRHERGIPRRPVRAGH
jgi:hypothetical protein